jgi:hypothetical protein
MMCLFILMGSLQSDGLKVLDPSDESGRPVGLQWSDPNMSKPSETAWIDTHAQLLMTKSKLCRKQHGPGVHIQTAAENYNSEAFQVACW